VLIEATIVEVALSDAYQAGVDWSRLAISGGLNLTQALIGGAAGAFTSGAMTLAYTNPTSSVGNISGTVKMLEQFGNTRVLSSPKLMTLNNQTALLKVVDNVVYFSIEASQSVTQGATAQVFNTTAHTVPVGMVMNLTPQINDNGQVTLTVRPTVTRINGFANDPNPSLCSVTISQANGGKCLTNPVPQVQTREMESVLQLISGQTAILGGLMQDKVQYNRNATPGVGNPAFTGQVADVFSMRDDITSKSELIVFLRPTIITSPSLESDDLRFYQRFLPRQAEAPAALVPAETGKTR
jgi:MSHA biogenesis protein MshL